MDAIRHTWHALVIGWWVTTRMYIPWEDPPLTDTHYIMDESKIMLLHKLDRDRMTGWMIQYWHKIVVTQSCTVTIFMSPWLTNVSTSCGISHCSHTGHDLTNCSKEVTACLVRIKTLFPIQYPRLQVLHVYDCIKSGTWICTICIWMHLNVELTEALILIMWV